MGKGFWLGIFLAAIVLFVWGFLFWGIAPVNPIDTGLDAAKAQDMLRQLALEDGVYVHPGYFFDLDRGAHLVVSLLTPEADLDEGMRRIAGRVREEAP